MRREMVSRREFLQRTSATGVGAALAVGATSSLHANLVQDAETPALLGGKPVRAKGWPEWPMWNPETDEERVIKVLRSGVWSRAGVVKEFEKKWANLIGTKRCLGTTNGTHALITALHVLGVGAGDEVLTTPYTFIATVDAILMNNAMPIFVDVDRETFQIDPNKLEEKITPNTKAILPVHILGLPADMPAINAVAKKHDLAVVEDCCQAWLAEINHRRMGSFGDLGCFSFQNSKNIPIGEGGAVVGDDEHLMDKAYSFHNFGRPHGSVQGSGYVMAGTKCRMAEYQAAIGLAQLERLEEQTEIRNKNAAYLSAQLNEIPGITPHRLSEGVTQAAYHLYPFRYDPAGFAGLSRGTFLSALRKEGVPCSGGYSPINAMPYLGDAFGSRVFQNSYPASALDFENYKERNQCPENDQLTREAVWLFHKLLLGSKRDMDDIVEAIAKIQRHAGELV
ncbi:MAG: DegT/DnrJ/EryC1/StrS family aminotransferase [Planctomycetota bacterium]